MGLANVFDLGQKIVELGFFEHISQATAFGHGDDLLERTEVPGVQGVGNGLDLDIDPDNDDIEVGKKPFFVGDLQFHEPSWKDQLQHEESWPTQLIRTPWLFFCLSVIG